MTGEPGAQAARAQVTIGQHQVGLAVVEPCMAGKVQHVGPKRLEGGRQRRVGGVVAEQHLHRACRVRLERCGQFARLGGGEVQVAWRVRPRRVRRGGVGHDQHPQGHPHPRQPARLLGDAHRHAVHRRALRQAGRAHGGQLPGYMLRLAAEHQAHRARRVGIERGCQRSDRVRTHELRQQAAVVGQRCRVVALQPARRRGQIRPGRRSALGFGQGPAAVGQARAQAAVGPQQAQGQRRRWLRPARALRGRRGDGLGHRGHPGRLCPRRGR